MNPNHKIASPELVPIRATWIRKTLPVWFSLFFMIQGFAVSAAELQAGLSKIDITPEHPVKMGGYESRKDLSQGVHDPLGARALVFDNEGVRVAFVSLDNLGFYNDTAEPLRKAILDACGLKPEELFLCAIHTHSAPILTLDPLKGGASNVDYTKQLQTKLVEVVRAALQRLEPVRASVCFGSSPVGVNRREVVQDTATNSKVVLGRNPWRMTDREVSVLKLMHVDRAELAGALFVYQTHSTSLGPKNYLVSGDIHGLAEQFLEKYYGNAVVMPGFAGASGNIDPWVRVLPDFRSTNGWIPEPVLMGTMLGEEVARALEGPQTSLTHARIATVFKSLALPGKTATDPKVTADLTAPLNITVAALGDIAFVGWGGEVFNEIGLAVKKGSPFQHTFILTHCNGAAGYLPTSESYPEGGYEVQSSHFGQGAAEALIEQTLQLLKGLHEANN
jgi:hypothetical protein